jgi:hypothetical protein
MESGMVIKLIELKPTQDTLLKIERVQSPIILLSGQVLRRREHNHESLQGRTPPG